MEKTSKNNLAKVLFYLNLGLMLINIFLYGRMILIAFASSCVYISEMKATKFLGLEVDVKIIDNTIRFLSPITILSAALNFLFRKNAVIVLISFIINLLLIVAGWYIKTVLMGC